MGRELFGTDGVRGLAGQYPLDQAGAQQIGRALGAHFAQAGQRMVIASDPRESSADLVAAVTKGLLKVGVKVTQAGVMPTPGLAYITRQHPEFVAGVMITASHNPAAYNGIKAFDSQGDKLSDGTEAAINQLIDAAVPDRGNAEAVVDSELVKEYEDFLVASADGLDLQGLPLAVDSANGAASNLAGRVFERLGAQVTPLFTAPDGRNINDGCGATHTEALQAAVKAQGLQAGVALDGDADRLVLVDSQGREMNGDYILYLLAVSQAASGVVATIMSNMGLEQALAARGIQLVRTQVGDRYVLEGLAETGYQLGGEQAGHIILPSILKTGDGLLAAVQCLKAISQADKNLAQWRDELQLVPQALINVPLADQTKLEDEAVTRYIEEITNQLGNSGRLLIRPSGTEPLVRIMVEAPYAEKVATQVAEKLQELIV